MLVVRHNDAVVEYADRLFNMRDGDMEDGGKMKPVDIFGFQRQNTRRGRRNTGIFVLMTIGLTSLILVIGMAQMLNSFMDRATNNDYAEDAFCLDRWN